MIQKLSPEKYAIEQTLLYSAVWKSDFAIDCHRQTDDKTDTKYIMELILNHGLI